MSRLDSFIRRLLAQRATIDHAAKLVAALPGPVLELGLGNGRTYDHLRERLGAREIFVFDRELAAHPSSRPDAGHFIEGDFRDTLPRALKRLGAKAVLAHCDIGSHSPEASRALAAEIAPLLAPLMASGAVVLGDQPMPHPAWRALELPGELEPGRYFMYRVE
ncbi:MAG TPA: class I SAM-dependent methyltransferase [Alphaproteobacteria bacterium]|nr:class I SAM-dependent methyltransferase [Alphaproteobacteria bacterium]